MSRVGRTLVGMFAELGSVPVALFTNSATALLQQIAQCESFAAACAAANLPGGATIPVACIMGAMGLAAAANAINNRREARKAADEFKAMAGQVTTIEQAVASLQSVLQRHGLAPTPLSPAELSSLAATLQNQDVTRVDDGVAQRMMLALDAAGFATAAHLQEVEGYVKETWLRTLHLWEEQRENAQWVKDADARLHAALARIETNTNLLPDMKAQLDELVQRTPAPAATLLAPRTSNFDAANITPNPGFKGRTTQLADLRAHFERPCDGAGKPLARGHRVIVGEGGMGKSQLAQRFAEQFADDWEGRWWIDTSPDLHLASVRALAKLLNPTTSDTATPGELRNIVRNALWGGKRHLIVLDSFELADAARPNYDLLQELDPGAPSCLLITTRDQNLPARFGPHLDLPVLPPDEAVLLIRRDTPRLQPTPDLPHNAALDKDLENLCRHLGCHAQAVDLAGAWLAMNKGLAPAALLKELKASDAATLALFDRADLHGHAPRYAATVGASLALHLPRFRGTPSWKVLEAVAYAAPDNIPAESLAKWTTLGLSQVQESLRLLAGASILWSLEGGEHGAARIHRLMQVVLRVLFRGDGPGGGPGGPGSGEPPLADYLRALREDYRGVEKHELSPQRTRMLPHAEAFLGHADGGRGGPGTPAAAALLRADVALHRLIIGDYAGAEADLKRSIDWGESQTPRDERSLAIWYASRARVRQDRGDYAGAEADLKRSIDWGESQTPRDERSLAIRYASRARLREARAVAAREAGDAASAAALFAKAKADTGNALAWWEKELPGDERAIAILRQDQARIENAERGGP
ncbi:MAG: ATP-binding protein [Phycisphaerae bacterium]|nr:ATP-binding protein [Phycisphaerae bacterium]